MRDLLDSSVWLPLSSPDHQHYDRAFRYWRNESAPELIFCRITQLALLRHLSSPAILGQKAMPGKAAWNALETWLSVPRIVFVDEPSGVSELLRDWSSRVDIRSGGWTDAYLAAFSIAADCRLVAFDGGFARYPGIQFLHLS